MLIHLVIGVFLHPLGTLLAARLLQGGDELGVVYRLALPFDGSGHLANLRLRDVGAVDALRLGAAGRQEQHVSVAQEPLGANSIENRAGVDTRGDLKRKAGGEIGLNQAGDHINRRPLRGQDQMNARGPPHLGQAGDRLLDLPTDGEHEVSQLIDYNNEIGQTVVREAEPVGHHSGRG